LFVLFNDTIFCKMLSISFLKELLHVDWKKETKETYKFYWKANLRIGWRAVENRISALFNDLDFDWIDGLSNDSLRRLLKVHLKMAKLGGEVVFSAGFGRHWARIKKTQFLHLIETHWLLKDPKPSDSFTILTQLHLTLFYDEEENFILINECNCGKQL